MDLLTGNRLPADDPAAEQRLDVVHIQWHHRFFVTGHGHYVDRVKRTWRFFRDVTSLKRRGVAIVWTVHNLENHERAGVRWEMYFNRRLAAAADAIIVHCDAAAELVRTAYRARRERIHVVPHAHYGGAYPEPPDAEAARKALGLAPDLRVLLFFGQIRAYKGVDQLLEVFSKIPDPKVRLAVVGLPKEPSLEKELRSKAATDDRIVLDLDFVSDARLAEYIAASDAVVLPYADSLTSGSAMLAASLGRAAVMPAIGCMADFPSDAAYLYDPADTDGLGRALAAAASAATAERGARARDYVTRWGWDDVARRLRGLYESCLA